MSLAEIILDDRRLQIRFTPPVLLSELLKESGVFFDMPCGGRQICKKCRINVSGDVSPATEFELSSLSQKEVLSGVRFACAAKALGDVTLTAAHAAQNEVILTGGTVKNVKLNPFGKKYGVAVDIGTTTVVMYLYCLKDGRAIDSASRRNPQAAFGADVISRLDCALKGELESLSLSVTNCVSEMAEQLCSKNDIPLSQIDAAVIAGNTAMMYLFCGLNPSSVAFAPFEQDNFFGCFKKGSQLSLSFDADVYLVRSISAYIGGDITAALTAVGFHERGQGRPSLLVDIGTNGEMALASGGGLLCCSTAAGPAFEGSGIRFGMTSKDGAVSGAVFTGMSFKYEVIGGIKPVGICGSGVLDITAALLDAGIVDETGKITETGHSFEENLCEHENQDAFLLPDTDIIVTQRDIRMVQLAKSAVRAGIDTLFVEAGISAADVSEFCLAGGFGTYLNINSAVKIGMIQSELLSVAKSVGNAAGAGAAMLLLDGDLIKISEQTAKSADTLDLTSNQTFVDGYVENMRF